MPDTKQTASAAQQAYNAMPWYQKLIHADPSFRPPPTPMEQALVSADTNLRQATASGNTPRMAGAAVRYLGSPLVGLANTVVDAVPSPSSAVKFAYGLLGPGASPKSSPAATAADVASTASGTAPPGKTKMPPPPPAQDDTPLTAMDWAQARAAKMLSNPKATVAQLQAAMGMVPAPVKSSGKDRVYDTFRQANDAIFDHQVKLIAPLKDSDPARYAAEFDKAQQAYIGNHLKSLGVDPLANALAEMQTQAEKD